MDEVLVDFTQALVDFHNKQNDTNYVRDDFFSYQFHKIWGGTSEDVTNEIYDFYKAKANENILPMKGAIKAVEQLSKNNDIYIITSRQNDFKKETLDWVKKYFGNNIKDVFFTNHAAKHGDEQHKSTYCNRLGVNLFVDDNASYALDCSDGRRKVLLFDNPWNKEVNLTNGIIRVKSWDEIVKIVSKMTNVAPLIIE